MRDLVEYIPFLLLGWLARHMSFRTVGRVGAILGGLAFRLPIRRREIALDNIAKAFPGLKPEEVRRIALGAFKNYATAMLEFLWSDGRSADELLKTASVVDIAVMQKHFLNGQAVILLSGHFGGWEWILKPVRLYLRRPVTTIIQHQRNGRIDTFVDRIRRQFDNPTVPMGFGVRGALKVLKEGGVIAMLGDQSGPKEAVFVDFFGRPAATHRGAAALSLKTNTPIVMTFLLRRPDGTYEVRFEEVDRTGLDGYTEANVIELTKRHTAILERYIRMRPDHWLWMHKRWKHTEFYQSLAHAGEHA